MSKARDIEVLDSNYILYSSNAVGAGGAGFSPKTLSGLQLWLRGDKGITLNDATITFPNDFDNAAWTKTRSSVTPNTQTDPFGVVDADVLIEDATATSTHFLSQAPGNIVSTIPTTLSVYAHANTRTWMAMDDGVAGTCYYNLGTGALGTASGGGVGTISPAGGGWYKCTLTVTSAVSNWRIYLATGDTVNSYSGDGASNIFLWGASVSQPKVSAWADQSGNGNNVTQGTTANQPLLIPNAQNNQPGLRFDGVNDALKSGAFTLNQPDQVFIVYKQIAFGAAGVNDIIFDGLTALSMAYGEDTTTKTFMNAGSAVTNAANFANGVYALGNFQYNTTTSIGKINDVQQLSGAVGAGNAGGFSLGGTGTPSRWTNIEVVEVIIYNRLLTPSEQGTITNYLNARYNLGIAASASGPAVGPPATITGLAAWYMGNLGITLNDATITFPNDFDNAAWTKIGVTVTANTVQDPFFGQLADSVVEDGSNGTHGVRQLATNAVATIPYTNRVYAKAGTRSWLFMDTNDSNDSAYFDLVNGVLGTVAGGATATITNAGNGWWLCTVTHTGAGLTADFFGASGNGGVSYQGVNGATAVYLYGASVSQPKVSAWADQSGNGRNLTQATAAAQPLYRPSAQQGQSGILFDGVDDCLNRAATNIWGAGAYSACLAIKTSTANSTHWLSDAIATAGVGFGITSNLRTVTHQNVENHTDAAPSASTETQIWNRVAASAPTLQVNGSNQALTNTVNTVTDPGGAAILSVGSFGSLSSFNACEVYEIILYNRDLTSGEQTTIQNYLKAKYGTP